MTIPSRGPLDQNISSAEERTANLFQPPGKGPLYILAPFVPTPEGVVDRMLQLARVTSDDVVYDLGCGDGRILIAAAVKYGARGVGIDIEPYRVEQSRENAGKAGVEHLVTVEWGDALALDLSPATVVTLYLGHWSTPRTQLLIEKSCGPGTRVVSHNFPLDGSPSAESEEVIDADGTVHKLFLWVALEKKVPDDQDAGPNNR